MCGWNLKFVVIHPPNEVGGGHTGFTLSVSPSVCPSRSVVLGADESPWPCDTPSWYTPLSWVILSKQKNLHLFLSQHICVFLLRRLFVHGLFVSWSTTGWWFIINSCASIHVTIYCSTVLPLVMGVGIRQKPQINGSVVLRADKSPWTCGTPNWYTPLSWMIVSK